MSGRKQMPLNYGFRDSKEFQSILDQIESGSFLEAIKSKPQFTYFGHVMRMDDEVEKKWLARVRSLEKWLSR